jgi:hypothetical protein
MRSCEASHCCVGGRLAECQDEVFEYVALNFCSVPLLVSELNLQKAVGVTCKHKMLS